MDKWGEAALYNLEGKRGTRMHILLCLYYSQVAFYDLNTVKAHDGNVCLRQSK